MGDVSKWVGRAMATRAVWRWWQTRHIRAENNARFLEDDETRKLLSRSHKGLLLDGVDGRLTPDSSFRNLAVIATTGAGKTSSFILPNLLTLDDSSIVATDPSGTLYARTSGDLARRGYDVVKLDPIDLAGSIGFNPLSRAASSPEMQEIAHILIRTQNAGAKVDPFWIAGAEEIVGVLIKCLKNHPGADRYANLANLQFLLQSFGKGDVLLPFVAANAPDDSTYNTFNSFIGQNEGSGEQWNKQLS